MGRRNNNNDFALGAIGIAALLIVAFIWKCSTAIGLDLATGLKVAGGLVVTAVLAWVALKYGSYSPLSFGNVWPILLGLVWFSFWPAFDCWAASSSTVPAFVEDGGTPWWDAWYTQAFGLVFLVGGGYWLRRLFQDRF